MVSVPSLIEPSTLKKLNHVALGLGVVFLLTGAFWGGKALLAKNRLASSNATEKSIQGQILEATKAVDDASKANIQERPTGIAAASHFQAKIEEAAARQSVVLSEFTVSPSLMPYASTYQASTEEEGWSQVSIKISVNGRLGNILGLLRSLNDQGALIETDSISFVRSSADENGGAIIGAKLDVRLLVKADAEAQA